jgi:nitrite reductase/ring-hydroxylating ferredoxin subunit
MDQLNRREVLVAAATVACACAFAQTRLLCAAATTAPVIIDVGPQSDYSKNGITTTWAKTNRISIIRHDNRIYASTATCTHKGCIVRPNTNGDGFVCPCHHATYDITGEVTHRPATVALERYAVSVNSDGHIIVDKSRHFYDNQWTDPASFIDVSAPQTQPAA